MRIEMGRAIESGWNTTIPNAFVQFMSSCDNKGPFILIIKN